MVLGDASEGKSLLLSSMCKIKSSKLKVKAPKVKAKKVKGSAVISLSPDSDFAPSLAEEEGCSVTIRDWTHNSVTFRTWDFSGDDLVVYITHQFFVSPHSIYLVAFDVESPGGAQSVEYWLQAIASRDIKCPVIVVATGPAGCIDAANEVFDRIAKKYGSRFGKFLLFEIFLTSKVKASTKLVREQLAVAATQHGMVGQRLPNSYLLIIQQLQQLLEAKNSCKEPPILQWEEFQTVADKLQLATENQREVAQFLHKIGCIIHFEEDPALRNIIFLEPQWLTEMFNRLYHSRNTHAKSLREGRLSHVTLPLIWTQPLYPKSTYDILLGLLRKFDIVFKIPTKEETTGISEDESIVPCMLSPQRPERVKEIWPTFEDQMSYMSRSWDFAFLPLGFFPRLIARTCHLPLISLECVWRTGMIVTDSTGNKALFEYNPSLFHLKLAVRTGAEKGNFASMLLDSINVFIEGWYKKQLQATKIYCVHCYKEHSFDPFVFSLSDCELCAARGKHYVLCRGIRPVRIDLIAPDVALADVPHLKRSTIKMDKVLGKGSFATVYKATYKHLDVAVKVINMQPDEDDDESKELRERFAEFRKEVSLMSGLDNPHLMELLGLCIEDDCMLMITEFAAFGDLYNFLQDPKNEVDWPLRLKIAMDVANGMNFLHTTTPPIIHRDLKTPNILLSSNQANARVVAKVADFGLSSTLVQTAAGRDVFNPIWLAPEVMMREAEYTEKADVYSFGIILWELVTRKLPFSEFDYTFTFKLENSIIEDNLRPTIPEGLPPAYERLMCECWQGDPSLRPTFAQVLDSLKELQSSLAPDMRLNLSFDSALQGGTDSSRVSSLGSNSTRTLVPAPIGADGMPSPARQSPRGQPEKFLGEKLSVSFASLNPKHGGSVKCMLVVNRYVWVGCGNGVISVWSVATKQKVTELLEHSSDAGNCAINALYLANGLVWAASQDLTLSIWEPQELVLVKRLKGTPVYGAMLAVDKHIWCATVTEPDAVHIRRSSNYRVRKTLAMAAPAECMVEVGDDEVWVGSWQEISVFSKSAMTPVKQLTGHTAMIHDMIKVGDQVWSCSSDKTIRLWTAAGECLKTLEGHGSRVFALLFHDNLVFSASWDKTIMIWDPKTSAFLKEIRDIHEDAISAMVSIDNVELWSGSWDHYISVLVRGSNMDVLSMAPPAGMSSFTSVPKKKKMHKAKSLRMTASRALARTTSAYVSPGSHGGAKGRPLMSSTIQ